MEDSILIKGNKYGISLTIDKNAKFDKVKEELTKKMEESKKFFNEANVGISFSGKQLTDSEQQELIKVITSTTALNVVCIIDTEEETERIFLNAVGRAKAMNTIATGNVAAKKDTYSTADTYHRGTIRSGQTLESDSTVVIVGDVNPGANIIAGGSIVVLGTLKGIVHAGCKGDSNAFVAALNLRPSQIRIGDIIARSPDDVKTKEKYIPQIAYISDGNICIETI
ncbi:MAG TPA: septum site-determining protein MinC [Eubacterium sp.]|nr:septum site-determining protein MinC [Eubacterium sp.]HBZ52443.1 septum site-determining protein MinC [Eubacterium sp.]